MILEKNIFGIEIDPRAGALAAFALVMKARAKDRRFFIRKVNPNICVLENVTFSDAELKQYVKAVGGGEWEVERKIDGRELFTEPLMETLRQFEQADNFGSLIRPMLTDAGYVLGLIEGKNLGGDLFLYNVHERVLKVLKQAEFLAPRYHVVVANPPYMGNNGLNDALKSYLTNFYEDGKADLFAAFMLRNFSLAKPKGMLGFVTPFVWMFLSSYEKLRDYILSEKTIYSLVKPSYTSFFASAIVPLVTFVVKNALEIIEGNYIDLGYLGSAESQPIKLREAILHPENENFYHVSTEDLRKIPGSPIAYSISNRIKELFIEYPPLSNYAEPRKGMVTADTSRFIRFWFEVSIKSIGFLCSSRQDAINTHRKWFPYMKGGIFRKWWGNRENIVNWGNDGYELLHMQPEGYKIGSTNHNLDYIFKPAITWTAVTSSDSGFRLNEDGFLFDTASGLCAIKDESNLFKILGLLNTPISSGVGLKKKPSGTS